LENLASDFMSSFFGSVKSKLNQLKANKQVKLGSFSLRNI